MSKTIFTKVSHRVCAIAVATVFLSACGTDPPPLDLRNFDRPTEISFACYGDLRVNGEVISSAQVLSSCTAHQRGEAPAGQEGIVSPLVYGFVLQPTRGTMAVINVEALGVQDNDPLTPGKNDIPIGSLPVGMAEDKSGCFIMTANSGSCDLAVVNVASALDSHQIAEVNRIAFRDPSGTPIQSRPRTIVTGPQSLEIGQLCPQKAEGLVYVSYPDCSLVVAVSAETGMVESAMVFRDDGSVEPASNADFSACPSQCAEQVGIAARSLLNDGGVGDGGAGDGGPDGGAPEVFEEEPVAMQVSPDGTKLYVTSQRSPYLTIMDLDVDGQLAGPVRRIRVSGEVGITAFAISDRIKMGGDERDGKAVLPGTEFQFAYLVATDSTIRVLDLDNEQECDTQVDPRYLKNESDVDFLACMPVGNPRTPPRRLHAKGPGIQLPGRFQVGRNGLASLAVPLDVAIVTNPSLETKTAVSSPDTMVGTFAFVTTASGFVFVINVDDDNYGDIKEEDDPVATFLPLALAHQIRDNVSDREALSKGCSTPSRGRAELGARLLSSPTQFINPRQIAGSKTYELPFLRGLRCEGEDELGNVVDAVVTELSFTADTDTRESAYADLRVVENQQWSMTWEGPITRDSLFVEIDGPSVRKAVLKKVGALLRLDDASDPFCSMGVQPYDMVSMLGCDPLLNDTQCGVGETCFVHPDTSSVVGTGVCVASNKLAEVENNCRDFLISRRRYSVSQSAKGALELVERRRTLRSSPLDGCQSDVQCESAALAEERMVTDLHPIDSGEEVEDSYQWVCEADPSRTPGVDRCVMSCTESRDCETGYHCSANRCVEAPLPPAECILTVQRYQVSVGEAFAVLGKDDGFIHPVVADSMSGMCVVPEDAHPLSVGRLPLRPQPCDDDDDFTTGPNPCSTEVSHTENYIPYVVENGKCLPQDAAKRTRNVKAVRFANPALRFHLVRPESQGDALCRNDQAGDADAFAAPYQGYQILFEVGGGFLPKIVPQLEAALPVRIKKGPTGKLWILDQGDASRVTRGRVFRLNPQAPSAFDLTTIL